MHPFMSASGAVLLQCMEKTYRKPQSLVWAVQGHACLGHAHVVYDHVPVIELQASCLDVGIADAVWVLLAYIGSAFQVGTFQWFLFISHSLGSGL